MKVILVDDEKAMLMILNRLLSRIGGVEISGKFQRGADALDWLRSEAADVAFLDIQMAGEDGVELAKRMLAIRGEMRIVFITSHKEFAVDAFDLGAVDYIVKPVISERLTQTIRRLAKQSGSAIDAGDEAANTLKASCLGCMTVSGRQGDVKWISGKSAELFAYLLMHRDKGAARDHILEDLFDGMPNRQTNDYLNTAVYQLRKIMKFHGQASAVVSINGRYKLQPEAVDADFIVFEEKVAAIGEITENNWRQAYEADGLYTGDLFGQKGYVWAYGERERLRWIASGFSKRLGKRLLELGQLDPAAAVVRRLLARDETDEYANALLLQYYAAVRDTPSLVDHYEAYSIKLREELGERPSTDMAQLFDRLQAELIR